MTSTKYIGMDVHKESISIAVRNDAGKMVMECVIETKANIILDFIHGLLELRPGFTKGLFLFVNLQPSLFQFAVVRSRQRNCFFQS